MSKRPRVLISYSHDSDEHSSRVLGLSQRLRADGVETQIDQYVNGTPQEGWPRWMLNRLDEATFVLVICTEVYYRRFRGIEIADKGKGADWEGALITQEIYEQRSATIKFVPVLFSADQRQFIPEPLRASTFYTLNSDANYDSLYRFLWGVAGVKPRPLGTPRELPERAGTTLTFGSHGEGGSAAGTELAPQQKSPDVLIVDALHRGNHTSLAAAIEAAEPGTKILVRPGLYREGVVVDKPLEIVGDGSVGDVVIEGHGKNAVLFCAEMGKIANMTFRQVGNAKRYCIDITRGRLDLQGCDITSQGLSCIAVHHGADARLRNNRIHNGNQSGIFLYERGRGIIEFNDICNNSYAAIVVTSGGSPIVRNNRIHSNNSGGVLFTENGGGVFEANEIFGNIASGVEIRSGSNPTVRGNRIYENKSTGVFVRDGGRGIFESNEIFLNAYTGVVIGRGDVTMRNNVVTKNGYEAIYVLSGGAGLFHGNKLRGNRKAAWNVSDDSLTKVTRIDNED